MMITRRSNHLTVFIINQLGHSIFIDKVGLSVLLNILLESQMRKLAGNLFYYLFSNDRLLLEGSCRVDRFLRDPLGDYHHADWFMMKLLRGSFATIRWSRR